MKNHEQSIYVHFVLMSHENLLHLKALDCFMQVSDDVSVRVGLLQKTASVTDLFWRPEDCHYDVICCSYCVYCVSTQIRKSKSEI